MVNVPPIPPLLCSTPPPIDFGEDDEDMDVLPPTLDSVVDDDFGDYLTVDDANTNEPLPSPRPPSVCDLPAVSIYDGLVPPTEENLKNHTTIPSSSSPPPPLDNKISKDSKNITKSINLTEAFNFEVKNTYEEETEIVESKISSMETKTTEQQSSPEDSETKTNDVLKTNSQTDSPVDKTPLDTSALNKNLKDLTIETSNIEAKCNSNKTNLSCMQNMVSIEDIEDDLSDDELYSPKTPKNFTETDNLNDYFKIEEIKTSSMTGNVTKVDSKDVDAKSLDSLDNNESASLGNDNDNEFKSFSSNSFIQNNYDMPPPLQDDTNSIDDDDFGDFADFQDFSTSVVTPAETQYFVNNTVPVNDNNNKQQNNNDLEFNGFKDFNNYDTTKEYTNVNTAEKEKKVAVENNTLEDSKACEEVEFELFTSHTNILPEVNSLEEKSEQNSLEEEIITQEISQDNNKALTDVNTSEDFVEETKDTSHLDNSFGDFNSAADDDDDDDFGNFSEFSKPASNLSSKTAKETTIKEEPMECSQINSNDDDEFDDFADFESHQIKTNTEQTLANETPNEDDDNNFPAHNDDEEEVNEDDDDDFGDFNTAQPITPTASSLTLTKTSQNTTAATTSLPPSHNLNERISKILQLMFTPATTQTADESYADQLKTDKIQDIPFTSIDAAKALEYQWLNSDTRHSFIRALGIDSRNILFGENWNPSLPRFAANLSFNPLKPMKPVQSSSSAADSNSVLEPMPITTSESCNTFEVEGSVKKESLDLGWKSSSTVEQTTEAFKENNPTSGTASATVITSVAHVTNDPPPAEPVSLTIFENPLDNEEKLSKTPPISEMESVPTFSSPLPTTNLNMELEATQNSGNLDDFVMNDIEENLKNTLNINEVVVTSTFTGSFKETHIYTPPKTNDFEAKPITVASTTSSSPTKVSPIDFDYEKAAMGVIINETVVKKEYRDVEYNPPFTMESLSKTVNNKIDMFETNYPNSNNTNNILSSTDKNIAGEQDEQESNDDFSEFQSVPSDANITATTAATKPLAASNNTKPLEVPKPATVSHGGMILSPAILIPQAISLEQQKPKIEWGDSTATINPEELARIEELFPEPKSLKSSNGSNSSQKSTPTHQMASTPSISATVANKELEGNLNDDDDDWSDFVSVTVTNNASAANRLANNNNILAKSPAGSPFKQRSPVVSHRMPPATHHNNSNNDDEWSDFVSSAPPSQQPTSYRVPQFNSGAWQNANFYNNPLSMYHKGPLNVPSSATAATQNTAQKSFYNNNNNYNISQQPYQIGNNLASVMLGNNQQQPTPPNNAYQQQIHVMQNFSTAPVPTPERLSAAAAANAAKNNQFQSIGSAKVAPSIALIPDLGFVAPAIPTHTSFINSLPKPSINTKK